MSKSSERARKIRQLEYDFKSKSERFSTLAREHAILTHHIKGLVAAVEALVNNYRDDVKTNALAAVRDAVAYVGETRARAEADVAQRKQDFAVQPEERK